MGSIFVRLGGLALAGSAILGATTILAPPAAADPFLGLFGNGADASASCSGSACNGGNGGLIFGNGGNGANGGNGGNGGLLFGNGGNGGNGSDLTRLPAGGNGGNGGLFFGSGGNGGNGADADYYYDPNAGIPDPRFKRSAQPGGNGGNGGLFSGNGGSGGAGGSDINVLNWNFSYTEGANGGNGGNAGIFSGSGGGGGNGGNAGSNIGEVIPGTGGAGGSGGSNGSAGANGQNGAVVTIPKNVGSRNAARAVAAEQTKATKAGSWRSGRR